MPRPDLGLHLLKWAGVRSVAVPAQHEIYFSISDDISDDTRYRASTLTITHHGGVDIEELPADKIATEPFDALTGFKGFIVANALDSIDAPREIISPQVQNLLRLWDQFNNYGMSMLELNPIRMMPADGDAAGGRLVPVTFDFKCTFDTDDPAWQRLMLPASLESGNYSAFELGVNELRTYQGQSDVFVINEQGTITAMTFGGGANALATELLGDAGTISSDFGGLDLTDPGDPHHGLDLVRIAADYALEYKQYKTRTKAAGNLSYAKIPCVNHPVFKGKGVNLDPREVYVRG